MEITNEKLLQGARNLKNKGFSQAQVDDWLKTKGSSLDEMRAFVKQQSAPQMTPEIKAQIAANNEAYKNKSHRGDVAMAFLTGFGEGVENGFNRVASGATFGGTDWLDRHGSGGQARLREDLQARANTEDLGSYNKAGEFLADLGGNVKGAGGKLATKIAGKGYKGLKALLLNSGIGGAAYGTTASDKLSEVPKKAVANATLASIFGLGLYGGGKGGLWLYNTARPYANATAGAIGNAVERIGLGKLKDLAQSAYNKGRSILEVGDDNLLTLTQEARQQTPKAYQNIEKAVETFNDTQNTRNNAIVNDAFGSRGKYENTDDIIRLAKEQASPIYERLQNTGDLAVIDPKIKSVMKNPYLRSEINSVRANPLYKAEYNTTKLSPTDWRVLDQTNRSINDKITAAIRAGEADKVRLLERQKYNLLNEVDDVVPEYKLARGIYEAEGKALKAQKIGENALFDNNTSAEKLARTMKDMTGYEKSALKVGAREKLMNTLESRENQALGLKKINNEQTKSKLKLVLGDKADNVINYADDEVKAMRNFNKLTKGSQTSEKQSVRDKISLLGRIFKNPTGIIGEVGDAMNSRINNAQNDVLTQLLTEKGGTSVRQELENYLARAARAEQLRNLANYISNVGSNDVLQIK